MESSLLSQLLSHLQLVSCLSKTTWFYLSNWLSPPIGNVANIELTLASGIQALRSCAGDVFAGSQNVLGCFTNDCLCQPDLFAFGPYLHWQFRSFSLHQQ
jgi:hypothetical protein